MLELAGNYDAFLCGDDTITRAVLDKSSPRLKIISKYGIGVDKIDVAGCSELGIPLTFCPGVNHTTVAEHTLYFLLALAKRGPDRDRSVRGGGWAVRDRIETWELAGKTLLLVGFGRIGREVACR